MKYIIFFFSIIIIPKTGIAQPYQSVFGKNLTTWSILSDIQGGWGAGNFYASTDTIFNSLTYKIIYYFDYSETGLLIREDSVNGKVWIANLTGDCLTTLQEQVVLDMSLQLGDTFNVSFSEFNQPNLGDTSIIVDSVYYVQGQKHIRFAKPAWADTSQVPVTEPITFIEGIGPNYSLLWINDNCDGFNGKYLLCVFKDSVEADYTNLRYNGECYPTIMGVEDLTLSKINISPNPGMEYLNITGVQDPKTVGIITNAIGQQVGQYNLAQGTNTIPLNNLPGGYYQITFYLKGTSVGVQKFVKI